VSYRPDSAIFGFLINARDITPPKESQQQATVLNRILRHNLRNGLTVILGRAKLLASAEADTNAERIASNAEAIVSSATDLQRLTDYTRDLSDMIGSHDVAQHRHDMTQTIEERIEKLAETYPAATFDLDAPEKQSVMAAPKLDLAVEHVLTNAVKHNDSETARVKITVRSSPNDDYVGLAVADNGPGIPKQEREVLLEGDEEPLKHGSGLGLWIVNWIVTRSGGYIEFDTNEPRGSQVTLNLPLAK
jgi:signal transduction histidine kinase